MRNGVLLRLASGVESVPDAGGIESFPDTGSVEPIPDAGCVEPLSDAPDGSGAEPLSDAGPGHDAGAVLLALAVPVQLPAAAAATAAAGGSGGAASAAAAAEADAVHDGYEARGVQHQVGGAARRIAEGAAPDRVWFFSECVFFFLPVLFSSITMVRGYLGLCLDVSFHCRFVPSTRFAPSD